MKRLWPLARPLLHALDPETAHDVTLKALAVWPIGAPRPDNPRLAVHAFGLRFPNPIGLAAGFDKNGTIAHKAAALGFGFAEIGTLTPLPQSGNPKPRLFRLPDRSAIINRFGFNNRGHAIARQRLGNRKGLIGINIGANKEAVDRVADYVAGIRAFVDIADYFTVNVSSPNTPGLRDLQKAEALDELLARVLDARDAKADAFGRKPVLLKIAPDLDLSELDAIVRVARARGVDGMIVSNTTLSRHGVGGARHAAEAGGLSGRPLFVPATRILAQTYLRVGRQFPLVGVGGVDSAEAACAKIEAGATLVQVYSGLVFEGPALVEKIKAGLVERLEGAELAELVGRGAERWASAT